MATEGNYNWMAFVPIRRQICAIACRYAPAANDPRNSKIRRRKQARTLNPATPLQR